MLSAAGASALALGTFLPSVAANATPTGSKAGSQVAAGRQVARSGHATWTLVRSVNMASLPQSGAQKAAGTSDYSARLITGARSSSKYQTVHSAKPGASFSSLATPPVKVHQNFAGTDATQSDCGCEPPDSNGAMSKSQIVETTNLAISIYKTSGSTLIRRTAIATFLGSSDSLSDPRIFFDNAWQRFVFVITVVPASSSATPALYLAVSKTSSATGSWLVYRGTFGGGPFAPGTLLDYPMVGMDENAIIISTNLFNSSGSFTTGTVIVAAKERIYNGFGWATPAFNVNFSTHPAFVEGIPQNQDGKEYLVASQIAYGGTGFDVYYLQNDSDPNSITLTYQGAASDANGTSSPPRANQPGSGNATLDALDGRLQAAPHQLNGNLWFARAEDLSGFPAVEYGAISESSLSVTSAFAYASNSSDDWNPSIAVYNNPSTGNYVFLNWAYTDPTNNVNTSTRVSGLSPADGIQSLAGVGKTLATGGLTQDTRFGDFSSVQVDPYPVGTCPAGETALVENEEFDSSGNWQMRDARVGFC